MFLSLQKLSHSYLSTRGLTLRKHGAVSWRITILTVLLLLLLLLMSIHIWSQHKQNLAY